jgi:anthranilate synthase/aminodeoxychorismate synthase-like glutamine amidotransferase
VILLIDNFDSFTYILFQYLSEWDEVRVIKNNEKLPSLEGYSSIVLSPGPGLPRTSGRLMDSIADLVGKRPILGVCLGHQAIAEHFGAKIEKAAEIFHGRVSPISHDSTGIFKSLPTPFLANRYHSWVVSHSDFPDELEVTAKTTDDVIMGIVSKSYPNVHGVQFHPESILTEHGKRIIQNFCEMYR